MMTSSSRLGPLAGCSSAPKDESESIEVSDVPEGERGIETSAASGGACKEGANMSKCSSKSLKSSDRNFCHATPSVVVKHGQPKNDRVVIV